MMNAKNGNKSASTDMIDKPDDQLTTGPLDVSADASSVVPQVTSVLLEVIDSLPDEE